MEQSIFTTVVFFFIRGHNTYSNGKRFKKKPGNVALAVFIFLNFAFAGLAAAQAPIITSFSPQGGAAGTTVTIKGTNFNTTAANDVVFFGAAQGKVTSATATCLKVTVPFGATTQNLSVLNFGTHLAALSSVPFNIVSNTQTVQASNTFTSQTTISGGFFGVSVVL